MLVDVVVAGRCSVRRDCRACYGKMLLLKMALILMLALIAFVPDASSQTAAYADKIPIGAIFDVKSSDDETRSAFSYAISSQNKIQSDFKLSIEEPSILSIKNNFVFVQSMCQLMASGVFAFFTTHTMATIDAIKSYSANYQMPFITSDIAMNSSGQEFGYELYMKPYYVKAISDIIKDKNWKDIWYIYDSDEGLERWEQLLGGFAANGYAVKTHLYRVKNATEAYLIPLRMDSSKGDAVTILLDLPTKDCEVLLQRLNSDSRGMFHHYFIVGLGVDEMSLEALQIGLNVVGLQLVDRSATTVRSFLEEWSQMDPQFYKGAGRRKIAYEAALVVDAVGVISRALKQMILEKPTVFKPTLRDGKVFNNGSEGISCDAEQTQTWQHGYDIMKAMREVDFEGLTGSIKFDKFGLRREYRLNVIEISESRGYEKIGIWYSERGFYGDAVRKGSIPFVKRARIVTTILTTPFMVKNDRPVEGNDMYEGYCADLTKKIASLIGFNYTISLVKDGKYGGKHKDSTWDGMIGELIRHEADIAIAPLTITYEREKVIDFSSPFMYTGISIMMKKPTKVISSAFSFLNPLSYEVWTCTVFAYIGVKVVLFLVNRFSRIGSHAEDKAKNKIVSIFGCFRITHRPVRSIPGRIVTNVWSLVTIVLVSFYTAKLFTELKAERMKSPIQSVDDLARQNEIKCGVINAGATMEFFRQSTILVYDRMWAVMRNAEPSVFVRSNEEGVTRVRMGNYAFLTDSTTIDYISARRPCDTMKVGRNFNIRGYGIAMPRGSDLIDRINLALMELRESGELQQLETKWWYERNECSNKDESSREQTKEGPLKLKNVAGLFYILIGCLILGLLILIFERLFKFHVAARIGKKKNDPIEEQIEVLE